MDISQMSDEEFENLVVPASKADFWEVLYEDGNGGPQYPITFFGTENEAASFCKEANRAMCGFYSYRFFV